MAFSLNKVMLIGNLGQDAEQRFTANNTSVTKFSIATQNSYKVGDDWKTETEWHNVVAFRLSDYYLKQLKKGAKIFLEGRLTTRKWDDNGTVKYFTEIIMEKIIPLSGVSNNNSVSTNDIPDQHIDAAGQSSKDDDLPF